MAYPWLASFVVELRTRLPNLRLDIPVQHSQRALDALRDDDALDAATLADLRDRLARKDQRSPRPWTTATLELIDRRPATRAGDLAPQLSMALRDFKANVRKLKALGLTESLKTGYRLSPRGAALLRSLRDMPTSQPIE